METDHPNSGLDRLVREKLLSEQPQIDYQPDKTATTWLLRLEVNQRNGTTKTAWKVLKTGNEQIPVHPFGGNLFFWGGNN